MWQKLHPGKDSSLYEIRALITMKGDEYWVMHEDDIRWFFHEI